MKLLLKNNSKYKRQHMLKPSSSVYLSPNSQPLQITEKPWSLSPRIHWLQILIIFVVVVGISITVYYKVIINLMELER